jgi:hypothetical protein
MAVAMSWRQPVFRFTGSFIESDLTNVFLTECVGQCHDTCIRKNSRVRNLSVVDLRIHIGHRSVAFRANWVKLKTKLYVEERTGRFYKGTYLAERYCTLMRPEATIN